MIIYTNKPILLTCLTAGLGLLAIARARAEEALPIHSFSLIEGGLPTAGMVMSGSTLYGVQENGGPSGVGTVFSIQTDGTGLTALHHFKLSEGVFPSADLVLLGDSVFGTTSGGVASNSGTVFKVGTNGTGFQILHRFSVPSSPNYFNADGAGPLGRLIASGSTLYGTTSFGGKAGNGTVFKIETSGTGFNALHNFSATPPFYPKINTEGSNPEAGLILDGATLFGTTPDGGKFGSGVVFAVSTNGSGFTNLHSFSPVKSYTNNEGSAPSGPLLLNSGTLYGATGHGGPASEGTLFSMATNGSAFSVLHQFSAISETGNADGGNPHGGLILLDNMLYGTASQGGDSGAGTVFTLSTAGSSFTVLHSFSAAPYDAGGSFRTNREGARPLGSLLYSGNNLYGTTVDGGTAGRGTVFVLAALPPELTVGLSGANLVLSWPADRDGFALESASSLAPNSTWASIQRPLILKDQQTYTMVPTGIEQYYRLKQ